MAAGDTSLSICSDALILLGAAPISSFTEGSDGAQACDRLYPDLRDNKYGWDIYGDQLFTNFDTVYIDYQSTVPEAKMPVYFVRLLRTALAAELGFVITDQLAKSDYFRSLAFGSPADANRGGLMRESINIDSRGKLPQVIEDYSLINVRN